MVSVKEELNFKYYSEVFQASNRQTLQYTKKPNDVQRFLFKDKMATLHTPQRVFRIPESNLANK
jgi:hypothetical protein